ncbi:MAG: hypothetical protein IJ012_03705 [Clostridia bacterium]|nr:hypothetical protein [Clostridia bacterium]
MKRMNILLAVLLLLALALCACDRTIDNSYHYDGALLGGGSGETEAGDSEIGDNETTDFPYLPIA